MTPIESVPLDTVRRRIGRPGRAKEHVALVKLAAVEERQWRPARPSVSQTMRSYLSEETSLADNHGREQAIGNLPLAQRQICALASAEAGGSRQLDASACL